MNARLSRFKPAVDKRVLILLAGVMWIAVGSLLLRMASSWLQAASDEPIWILLGSGFVAALLIHHFGFLRVVDKNLDRILPMQDKRCVFSFLQAKNYALIGVMMGTGIALRHSPIPKPYLAVLYIGLGLALILSSLRYLRHFVDAMLQSQV